VDQSKRAISKGTSRHFASDSHDRVICIGVNWFTNQHFGIPHRYYLDTASSSGEGIVAHLREADSHDSAT
jgi:hypothetical protein